MKREIHAKLYEQIEPFFPDLDNFFEKIEKQLEDHLIKLFEEIDITASVKTDKYSLPHQGEVVVKLHRESYIPAMYEFTRICRPIVKKMLEENAYKIRFYIHAETYDNNVAVGPLKVTGIFGVGFKYSFRYYLHK